MTGEGSNNGMFTNRKSIADGDIEAKSGYEHVSAIEREVSPIEQNKYGGNIYGDAINIVDVDKWACSLARILEDVPHYMCCPGHPGRISRIPQNLRDIDRNAYEPNFVSIGPYHRSKPKVQQTEKKKWFALKCFLEQKPELTLKDYLKEIQSVEPAARGFYTDVDMESQQFMEMLLLDSLFILPLFCGMPGCHESMSQTNTINGRVNQINEDVGSSDDNVDTSMMARENNSQDETVFEEDDEDRLRFFWNLFPHDLFLLENQLPFFVLEKIYVLVYGGSTSLLSIMTDKIGILLSDYAKVDLERLIAQTEEVHHLLHLCHLFFRPNLQQGSNSGQILESGQMFRLGSALQLYEAGVCFEARSSSTNHSLLDITFGSTGKMIMPCLHVDDRINSLLRNLIALEQMKYPTMGLHLSSYAVLLLHLITTPEDVQLLRRKGIIHHHLASDKEMMYFVNRLSTGLSFDYMDDIYSLKSLFYELRRYTERRNPQWKAWLKHRYFNNPWMTISLLAASLLLFVTALQTYYTVYSYYRP